jgi:hypothetical protein
VYAPIFILAGFRSRLSRRLFSNLAFFVAHNDHFDLFDVESQPQERDEFFLQENTTPEARVDKRISALSILRDEWLDSVDRAYRIMNAVFSNAGA